jgi:hypothetical protein
LAGAPAFGPGVVSAAAAANAASGLRSEVGAVAELLLDPPIDDSLDAEIFDDGAFDDGASLVLSSILANAGAAITAQAKRAASMLFRIVASVALYIGVTFLMIAFRHF